MRNTSKDQTNPWPEISWIYWILGRHSGTLGRMGSDQFRGHSAINQVETSGAIAKASTGAPAELLAPGITGALMESIVILHDPWFLFVGRTMATDFCFKCPEKSPEIGTFHQVLWYSASVCRWCRTSPAPKFEAVSANFSKASPKKKKQKRQVCCWHGRKVWGGMNIHKLKWLLLLLLL